MIIITIIIQIKQAPLGRDPHLRGKVELHMCETILK